MSQPYAAPVTHGVPVLLLLLLVVAASQVNAAFTANVWDIKVEVGDNVTKDQPLLVLEAMKMESPILSPRDGVVKAITAAQGSLTHAGQLLVVIEAAA